MRLRKFQQKPENIYHIILHCDCVNALWELLTPTLIKLHPGGVTDEEKAFGIIEATRSPGVILRNWITYSLRKVATDMEKSAFHAPNIDCTRKIKAKLNEMVQEEIRIKI